MPFVLSVLAALVVSAAGGSHRFTIGLTTGAGAAASSASAGAAGLGGDGAAGSALVRPPDKTSAPAMRTTADHLTPAMGSLKYDGTPLSVGKATLLRG